MNEAEREGEREVTLRLILFQVLHIRQFWKRWILNLKSIWCTQNTSCIQRQWIRGIKWRMCNQKLHYIRKGLIMPRHKILLPILLNYYTMCLSHCTMWFYHEEVFALSLLNASESGYRFLSKLFVLPSRKKTLQNLLSIISSRTGIKAKIFDTSKEKVFNMLEQEKYCVTIFLVSNSIATT